MNRRGFLLSAIGLIATPSIVRAESLMALAPVPKLTYLPAHQLGGSLLTPEIIAREALRLFRQSNPFIDQLAREHERRRGVIRGIQ